jgi:hypothetical protein
MAQNVHRWRTLTVSSTCGDVETFCAQGFFSNQCLFFFHGFACPLDAMPGRQKKSNHAKSSLPDTDVCASDVAPSSARAIKSD